MAQVKSSDFREEHLTLGDVWTWSSDFDEPEDSLVTVPLTEDALANADSLLVRASFETACGDRLQGLVIYSMGSESVFAIELLKGEEAFTFNEHLPDACRSELGRLAATLGRDTAELLPIAYKVATEKLAVPPGTFAF